MKFKIFKFDNVTSTNDMAITLIREKKIKSGFVQSLIQTKGRGTRGKKWISKKGNLFATIFFPLNKEYPSFSEFSIINPIIILNIVQKICKDKKVNLKFPNDILINKKKVCGILQEVITAKGKKFLIIGIGININSNPLINTTYQSTNIFKESNKKLKLKPFINLIIKSYEKFFINLTSYNYNFYKQKAEILSN